jgi:hypothetical protein
MHFVTFLIVRKNEKINESTIEEHMEKYHQDNENQFKIEIEIEKKDIQKEAEKIVKNLIKDERTTLEDLFNKIEVYRKYNKNGDYIKTVKEENDYAEDEEGNLGYKYNPYSFYDWYVIGGRWDGFLSGKEHTTDNGFNFGAKCRTIKNNMISVKKYKELLKTHNKTPRDKLPFYIVSYKEDEHIDTETWKKKDMINFLKDYDEQDKIINLDCHN